MYLVVGVIGIAANAQAQVGERYQTRDPQTCDSKQEPTSGPITAELAELYLRCNIEAESAGKLYLLENLSVQVGKGTPFMELPGASRPFGGDPDGLVYQIRGSMSRYQCGPISDILENASKNCNLYQESKATGMCFRDGFADWICTMRDPRSVDTFGVPPPPRQ